MKKDQVQSVNALHMIKWERIGARPSLFTISWWGRHWSVKGRDSDIHSSILRIQATFGPMTQSTAVPTSETGRNWLRIEATNIVLIMLSNSVWEL